MAEVVCPRSKFNGLACLQGNQASTGGIVMSTNADVTSESVAVAINEMCKNQDAALHVTILYSIFAAVVFGILVYVALFARNRDSNEDDAASELGCFGRLKSKCLALLHKPLVMSVVGLTWKTG